MHCLGTDNCTTNTDKNWFSMSEKFCDLLFYSNSIPFPVHPHLTLVSTFWKIKRSKTKPSSVWFGSDLQQKPFSLVFTFFFGKIPAILTEISTDLWQRPFFGLYLLLATDTRITGQSEHRFCTTNLQLCGVHLWKKCIWPIPEKRLGSPGLHRYLMKSVNTIPTSCLYIRQGYIA